MKRAKTARDGLEIIRLAQKTIIIEKKKLKKERVRLLQKIADIDRILGAPTMAMEEEPGFKRAVGKRRRSGKRGASTKDIILNFLADGSPKKAKDIIGAVVKAGKSRVIGAALANLVKEKKIVNPSRGQYKLK